MKKTIKELADELGISKTAINKKVNENQKRKHFSKIGNKFVIDEEGQKLIKGMFLSENANYRKLESENRKPEEVFEVSDLILALNDRVSSTEKQIEEKDKQIANMQKLLDQQQVLTLQANKKIAELETTLENPQQVKNDETEEQAPKKENFWAKWFR